MTSSTRSKTERWALVLGLLLGVCAYGAEMAADPRVTQLVTRGANSYERGRYDDAIRDYSEAFALQPLPALLFNLGQCHRLRGDFERARSFYERYLRMSPDGKNAPVARELLERREMRARPAGDTPRRAVLQPSAMRQAKATEVSASASADNTPLYQRWWFWTGVGAAATATAAAIVVASLPRAPEPSLGAGRFK